MTDETTTKIIAKALNGLEYPFRYPNDLNDLAKASGIVIAYGMSDDLLQFNGAIYDELGAWRGREVLVCADCVLPDFDNIEHTESECQRYFSLKPHARKIKAVWCPTKDGEEKPWASWSIETQIPHETFDVMEDGELFCRGIVFYLTDIERAPA